MKPMPTLSRRALLALALPLPAGLAAQTGQAAPAAPVADSLARAALGVRRGERAVLLGAALAGPRIVAVGERGLVLLSDDGGASWRQASVPVAATLTAVRFADEREGVAVGHRGVVLRSSDGGASWRVVLDGTRAATLVLEAARAAQDSAQTANAERLLADGADKPWLDVLMSDAAQIVVVGAYGLALASNDGGQSWASWLERIDNPKGLHLNAIRRRGDVLLIAGEQGLLQRSADGGRSFRRLESPYKGSFFTAELPAEQDIVIAGLRGNAWRSHDDGRSWSRLQASDAASITASLLTVDGRLLFGNQAGQVLRLADDRLEAINPTALPPINALVAPAGQPLLALTLLGAIPLKPALKPALKPVAGNC